MNKKTIYTRNSQLHEQISCCKTIVVLSPRL